MRSILIRTLALWIVIAQKFGWMQCASRIGLANCSSDQTHAVIRLALLSTSHSLALTLKRRQPKYIGSDSTGHERKVDRTKYVLQKLQHADATHAVAQSSIICSLLCSPTQSRNAQKLSYMSSRLP